MNDELNKNDLIKKRVWDDILHERYWQDAKWGGSKHDDNHTSYEFINFIVEYNEKARQCYSNSPDIRFTRKRLVQVAALAVAAVESIDRKLAVKYENE